MENYVRAEMEVVEFEAEDVIVTSGCFPVLWQPDCPAELPMD